MIYERKTKGSLPVLAICYDFDKTLTPDDMQAQGYIQSVGYDVRRFWEETDELAHAHGMDANLAYMARIVPKRGLLIHMCHDISHADYLKELPPHIAPA